MLHFYTYGIVLTHLQQEHQRLTLIFHLSNALGKKQKQCYTAAFSCALNCTSGDIAVTRLKGGELDKNTYIL